jgi:lipoprotein Spr
MRSITKLKTRTIVSGVAAVLTALLVGCLTPQVRYRSPDASPPGPKGRSEESAADRSRADAEGTTGDRRLKKVIDFYVGTPYRFGGNNRAGMDCSGLVVRVYHEAYRIELPRTTAELYRRGAPVSLRNARPGDLVFFWEVPGRSVDHVGIYMGDRRFAHASRSRGVVYSSLRQNYHKRRLAGIRRVR